MAGKNLILFFLVTFINFVAHANDLLCSPLTCSFTKKTLVRLKWPSDPKEKFHDKLWRKAVNYFSDHKSIFFDEIDCEKRPSTCLLYANASTPSYVMQIENVPIAVCRPKNYDDIESFCMEMLGSKYQRKHNYYAYKSECNTTFPTLTGIEVNSTTFNATVECGLTFVLFHQPLCCHCKKIKAFWNALVNLYENKEIKFVYMECVEQTEKEFCYSHQAIGFPTMNFYRDGIFIEEYSGSESLKEFQEFLDEQLESKSECPQSVNSQKSQSLEELN